MGRSSALKLVPVEAVLISAQSSRNCCARGASWRPRRSGDPCCAGLPPQDYLVLLHAELSLFTDGRHMKEGYTDADSALMMTAVGLTSEALLVSGGVINPNKDDLR